MIKKTIAALFLIFVLSFSTLAIANAISLPMDNSLEVQTQPTLRYHVNLSENIGIYENDKSGNKNENNQETIKKQNSIFLSEKINIQTGNIYKIAISQIKHNSDQMAMLERIFEKTKPTRISGTNYLQNDGLSLTLLANENDQSDDSAKFGFLDTTVLAEYWPITEQAQSTYVTGQVGQILGTFSDQVETNEILANLGTIISLDRTSTLMLLLPVTALIFIHSENQRFEFFNFRRVFCYIFIVILLSSGVITPLSISASYWPHAYAEEFDESVSVIPSSDTKTKGKPTDSEPKGKPTDSEPKGKPTDSEPKGKPTDSEPKGKPIKSNATSTEIDVNATSTEIDVNATSTEIDVNATSTEIDVNATSTEIDVNATSTEIDVNATSTEIDVNATSTEIQEFDESVSVIPSNETSTEIQEFDESVSVIPSDSTIVEIPDPTISLDFDYDLTKKFTDETYNDSLELDGENDFLQIYENSTNQVSYLSISAWVKPDYSQGSPEFTVISKEKSFSLSINNNIVPEKTAEFSVFDGIKWTTVTSTSIVNEDWTFLVATFDGDSIGIGIDDKKLKTKPVSNVTSIHDGKLVTTTVENLSSEEDIVIGASINTNRGEFTPYNKFSGEIDGVLLFDSLLDESQIQKIYNENADSYYVQPEITFEEILESLDTIESTIILTSDVNATGFVDVNATLPEITEIPEIVPINTTLSVIPEFVETVFVIPSNATSTIPVNVTTTDLPVNPLLTTIEDSYLITEDVELNLEFYSEYDVLMQELEELENSALLLSDVEEDLNQADQTLTQPEITEFDQSVSVSQSNVTNTQISTPVLGFITALFSIPKADAIEPTSEDDSKLEIIKAKDEIKNLREKIKEIKADGELFPEELMEAKKQLKSTLNQLKLTSDQISKTQMKDVASTLSQSADDIEKIGDVEPETPIQSGAWIGNDEQITTEIYDSSGNHISIVPEFEKVRDGKFKLKLSFDQSYNPGLYKVKTTINVNGETYIVEDEFAWGLVSLNTEKSIYRPGETAKFIIVVLDSEGHPVCDANLSMIINDPSLNNHALSLGNGIVANQECGLYDAQFVTVEEGAHQVRIHADAEGIDTNFETTFDVSSYFEFDIIRTAQSKIDPITNPNSFDVKVDIESFNGENSIQIQEFVPSVFDVVTDAQVTTSGNQKILTWNKNLIEDKTTIEYSYSIPLEFPKLYPLGPIEISYGNSTFTEARPWFVAADPPAPTITLDNTSGTPAAAATDGSNQVTLSSFNVPLGEERLLLVGVSNDGSQTVSGLSWQGGGSFSQAHSAATGVVNVEFWYLLAPATGTGDVVVTFTGSADAVVGAYAISGVEQGGPIGATNQNTGNSGTNLSVSLTANDDASWIFGAAVKDSRTLTTSTQTQGWVGSVGSTSLGGASSHTNAPAGTGSQTFTWTASGNGGRHAEIVIEVIPSGNKILSESITITDTVTKSFTKSLTESITINDTVTPVLGKSLPESITINDTLRKSFTKSLTESITINDTVTPVLGKSLPESITINDTLRKSFTKSLTESITINDTVTPVLSLSPLPESIAINDTLRKSFTKSLTESITINDTVTPALTQTLTESITINDTLRKSFTKTLTESITINDVVTPALGRTLPESITINDTLRKSFTKTLTESITISDTLLTTSDLTVTLTESITISDTPPSSGGGGGPASPVIDLGGILLQTFMIEEISYDVCNENIIRILVSNDDASIPTVLVHTESGVVEAKLADHQPFRELNQFTTVDKYLFEAPLDPQAKSIFVEATALVGPQTITTTGTAQITECSEIIIFEKLPTEYEEVPVDVPQIFDTKLQLGDDRKHLAEIESEKLYLENEPLTISTIIHSKTPIKIVEVRIVSAEQPDEFISIPMPVTSLPISDALLASVAIPQELIVSPAISYSIYVEDENEVAQESTQFEIGVMPPVKPNASVEMDTQTSKHDGTRLRTSTYVTLDANAYGTVSLFVNEVEIATKSLFLVQGQTKVDLDWFIPKEGKQMTYDLRAEVKLYGDSVSTDITKLNTFPRTQLISISEMKSISSLIDEVGNVIAQPGLVYASDNTYENLRFQVTTKDGFCLVGPSENCVVQESTANERGGTRNVEYGGTILEIKLNDPFGEFESLLITTVDEIPSDIEITLVPLKEITKGPIEELIEDLVEEPIEAPIDDPIDGFVPPVFAAEDIDVKVKYRAISELVTVKSA